MNVLVHRRARSLTHTGTHTHICVREPQVRKQYHNVERGVIFHEEDHVAVVKGRTGAADFPDRKKNEHVSVVHVHSGLSAEASVSTHTHTHTHTNRYSHAPSPVLFFNLPLHPTLSSLSPNQIPEGHLKPIPEDRQRSPRERLRKGESAYGFRLRDDKEPPQVCVWRGAALVGSLL